MDRKWHECDWMDGRAMVDECCFYLGSRFFDYHACVYTILLRSRLPPFFFALFFFFSKIFRSHSSRIKYLARRAPNHFPLVSNVKRSSRVLLSCCLFFFFSVSIQYTGFLSMSVCVVWYIDIDMCVYRKIEISMLKMYRASRKQSINQSTLLYMPTYLTTCWSKLGRYLYACVGISICLPKQ